jgi:hypothetical protein
MIYGTLVASPTEMRDEQGATGIYFCFPDVSVRYDGRFKLHATLLRITGYVIPLSWVQFELMAADKRCVQHEQRYLRSCQFLNTSLLVCVFTSILDKLTE